MSRSTIDLEHCAIHAADGETGHVNDIDFDHTAWAVETEEPVSRQHEVEAMDHCGHPCSWRHGRAGRRADTAALA